MTHPILAVSTTAASAAVVIRPAPLTVRMTGGTTLRRGGRARFGYRVKNATGG